MKRITGSWKVISNLKECPVCRSRYDSSVVLCPADDSILHEITVTKYPKNDSLLIGAQIEDLLSQMRESVLCNNIDRFKTLIFKTASYFRIAQDYSSAVKWFHLLELLGDGDPTNTHLPAIVDLHIRLGQPSVALLHIRRLASILNERHRPDLADEYFKQFITHQPTDTAWVREVMSVIDEFGFSINPTTEDIPELPLEDLMPLDELRLKDTSAIRSALSTAEQKSLRLSGSFKITNEMGRISFEDIHILIADNEKGVTDLLSQLLGEFGCSVTVVNNLETALSELAKCTPSIIISDRLLPGFDILYSQVRSDHSLSRVPFILLTADEPFEEVLGDAFFDVWFKPFDVEELIVKFRVLLQRVKLASGLKGNLVDMSLSELLRIISTERLTGELRVFDGIKSGVIFIDNGHIIDSLTEDLCGERAIYMLLISCLNTGYFEFSSKAIERTPVIKSSLEGIFSEASRRAELEASIIESLPSPEVFLSLQSGALDSFGSDQYELIRVSQLFDGTLSLGDCMNALHGDLEAVQLVEGLYKTGLLKIVDFGVI